MGCAGMVCIYMRCVTCISSCVDVRVYVCARQFERGHVDGLLRGWNVLLVESGACKSQTRARTRACKHTHKGHNFVFPDPYLPSFDVIYHWERTSAKKNTKERDCGGSLPKRQCKRTPSTTTMKGVCSNTSAQVDPHIRCPFLNI